MENNLNCFVIFPDELWSINIGSAIKRSIQKNFEINVSLKSYNSLLQDKFQHLHQETGENTIFILGCIDENSIEVHYKLGLAFGKKSKVIIIDLSEQTNELKLPSFVKYYCQIKPIDGNPFMEQLTEAIEHIDGGPEKSEYYKGLVNIRSIENETNIKIEVISEVEFIEKVAKYKFPDDYNTFQYAPAYFIARDVRQLDSIILAKKTTIIKKTLDKKTKIFISYSKEDIRFKNELIKFLKPLESQITLFHDREILPGNKWDDEIQKGLKSSDIILCLISSDFLATDYILKTEIPIALEMEASGKATVIPVIVRTCNWENTPLARFNALPSKGVDVDSFDSRDKAWKAVSSGIEEVLNTKT